jgi:thiosulfate/3-mercaptopyruvate sulfurtransferase
MIENKGYTHPEALVDAEWVQAHLTDPTVRLMEGEVASR